MDAPLLTTYRAPLLYRSEVTPERVREELIRCFLSAMSCVPTPRGAAEPSARAARAEIVGFLRDAFAGAGATYEEPTKEAIRAAMDQCRSRAHQMGIPEDVVEQHWSEMMRLVEQLPDTPLY